MNTTKIQSAPKVWVAFTPELEVLENNIILAKRYKTIVSINLNLWNVKLNFSILFKSSAEFI